MQPAVFPMIQDLGNIIGSQVQEKHQVACMLAICGRNTCSQNSLHHGAFPIADAVVRLW